MSAFWKIFAIGTAVATAVLITTQVKAAGQYVCLIDGLTFNTQAELEQHYLTYHPGEPIPIKVTWS